MRNELLYRDEHIAIEYNFAGDWIYVNWRGYLHQEKVIFGCEKLLDLMKAQACYRILNDNTLVEGKWSSASRWGGEVWFPAMREAGLQWFAWVYSQSMLSRLSADKMVKLANNPKCIELFDHLDLAEDWLRSKL